MQEELNKLRESHGILIGMIKNHHVSIDLEKGIRHSEQDLENHPFLQDSKNQTFGPKLDSKQNVSAQ